MFKKRGRKKSIAVLNRSKRLWEISAKDYPAFGVSAPNYKSAKKKAILELGEREIEDVGSKIYFGSGLTRRKTECYALNRIMNPDPKL